MKTLKPVSLAGKKLTDVFHVCAFFRSREEEYRVLSPFVSEGLEGGEKAIYIVDPAKQDEHARRLATAGIDLERHRDNLHTKTWAETYLDGGSFDPDKMIAKIQNVFDTAKKEGTSRLRLIGHMEWIHTGARGTEQLLEYEVRCNALLASHHHPAVCTYQVDRLSAETMMDILRAHPLAIIGGVLQENPFFMQPEQMLQELRKRKAA